MKDGEKNKIESLKIYREIMEAVSGGKLKLIDQQESNMRVATGKFILEEEINEAKEIASLRKRVKLILENLDFRSKERFHILLAMTEAITNTLKYVGRGKVTVKLENNNLKIIISDHGTGINFKELSKVTLAKSYAQESNFSLGYGFKLMLKFIDLLFLKTDSDGTTLILKKEIS